MNDQILNGGLPDRLITAKELIRVIPYSLVWIQRLEKRGEFPKRIRLGPNRVGWSLQEVTAWIDERKAQRPAA